MANLYNVLDCCYLNISKLKKSPRFILALIMGILICVFMTNHTINLSYLFHTDIQIFEPFIWCFSDSESILFTSFALILPMSQMPDLDNSDMNLIFKKGKLNWLLGTIFTLILVAVLYMLILLIATGLMTMLNVSFLNEWSDTAITMSLNPYAFEKTLTVVRTVIKTGTPFECMIEIFFLTTSYMLFLLSVNLFVSLKYSKKTAVTTIFLVSFLSFLLNPDYFVLWLNLDSNMKYIANLMSVWFSPLNHSVYTMHSRGYDELPTVFQSLSLFALITMIFFAISFLTLRKKDIAFKGEQDE